MLAGFRRRGVSGCKLIASSIRQTFTRQIAERRQGCDGQLQWPELPSLIVRLSVPARSCWALHISFAVKDEIATLERAANPD